jgi:hypothetical protein
MNVNKKILLTLIAWVSLMPCVVKSFLPCGTTIPGVLRVGILPGNLPFSDIDAFGNAIGFDPLLAQAVAQLLGYETVQFIGFGSTAAAEAALDTGTIDIYADSSNSLPLALSPYIGVITDISQLYATNTARGWELSLGCCGLARRIELALNEIVNNGRYAEILQLLRLNNLTDGFTLGVPAPGVLLEPFPFASSEAGTIPTTCISAGPVSLPQTNCISAFLQAGCSISITFTGVTGQSSNNIL